MSLIDPEDWDQLRYLARHLLCDECEVQGAHCGDSVDLAVDGFEDLIGKYMSYGKDNAEHALIEQQRARMKAEARAEVFDEVMRWADELDRRADAQKARSKSGLRPVPMQDPNSIRSWAVKKLEEEERP